MKKRKRNSLINKKGITTDTGIPYHTLRERNFDEKQKRKIIKAIEEGVEDLFRERYNLCKASDTDYNARTDSKDL